MKIKINRPKPVKLPPVTVDLMNLSLDEIKALRIGVGELSGGVAHDLGLGSGPLAAGMIVGGLYDALKAAERQAR